MIVLAPGAAVSFLLAINLSSISIKNCNFAHAPQSRVEDKLLAASFLSERLPPAQCSGGRLWGQYGAPLCMHTRRPFLKPPSESLQEPRPRRMCHDPPRHAAIPKLSEEP